MDKKFDSIYSPGKKITGGQWLAEFICGRLARSKGSDLPPLFWKTSPVWEKEYLRQLRAANSLTRLYSLSAISAALKSKNGKKVLSLSASWFDDIIKTEQRKIDLVKLIEVDKIEEEKEDKGLPISRPQFSPKKSLKDKLDG